MRGQPARGWDCVGVDCKWERILSRAIRSGAFYWVTPMHGKRVGLYVDTKRFKCRSCTKTFYEKLPAVDEKRLMTSRLVEWVGKHAIKRTFASIAEEVGVTEGTVRSVFSDYVNELEKTVRFETPQWMGIDEIHLIKPRGVISNIENNTIVELLPNRNKETVTRYLSQLEGRDRIHYVAMDMWLPYRDAVETVLPQAMIIIDKFHVVKMANEAMERVRRQIQARSRGQVRDMGEVHPAGCQGRIL